MDEALLKSGQWPNVALTPGTHRHAATGERVEIPKWARVDSGAVIYENACKPDRDGNCPACGETVAERRGISLRKGGEAMSMLSKQADELRKMADMLGVNGVCTGDVSKLYVMLRGAADTIESLSDKLQGVMGTRYNELFGTPERAARTWIKFNGIYRCADCPICHDEYGETCEIPGECAWADEEGGYDLLSEWLRGDA